MKGGHPVSRTKRRRRNLTHRRHRDSAIPALLTQRQVRRFLSAAVARPGMQAGPRNRAADIPCLKEIGWALALMLPTGRSGFVMLGNFGLHWGCRGSAVNSRTVSSRSQREGASGMPNVACVQQRRSKFGFRETDCRYRSCYFASLLVCLLDGRLQPEEAARFRKRA